MLNFRYSLLSLLFFLSVSASGQDSLAVEPKAIFDLEDTVAAMPIVSSVGFVLDYGKFAGLILETESRYEIGAQVEFRNQWFVVGEFGFGTLTPKNAYVNANYKSTGSYYRLGLGYKIDMNQKNNAFLSVRYGASSFEDSGVAKIASESGLYEEYLEPFERKDLAANWFEVILTTETRLWKGLYAGMHLRLRIMNEYDKHAPIDVYSVPGYGRTIDKSIPALNLYVKYALEWF